MRAHDSGRSVGEKMINSTSTKSPLLLMAVLIVIAMAMMAMPSSGEVGRGTSEKPRAATLLETDRDTYIASGCGGCAWRDWHDVEVGNESFLGNEFALFHPGARRSRSCPFEWLLSWTCSYWLFLDALGSAHGVPHPSTAVSRSAWRRW